MQLAEHLLSSAADKQPLPFVDSGVCWSTWPGCNFLQKEKANCDKDIAAQRQIRHACFTRANIFAFASVDGAIARHRPSGIGRIAMALPRSVAQRCLAISRKRHERLWYLRMLSYHNYVAPASDIWVKIRGRHFGTEWSRSNSLL